MSALTVERAVLGDPLTQPLIRELTHEYVTRYGPGGRQEMARYGAEEFAPPHGLLLLLLRGGEPVAGGAYRRHADEATAEVKRMWTAAGHRRQGSGPTSHPRLPRDAWHALSPHRLKGRVHPVQGLPPGTPRARTSRREAGLRPTTGVRGRARGRRVLAELEAAAREAGYRRILLTTGPRQPEARGLYLAAGYTPLFDTRVEPAPDGGPLPFEKHLLTTGTAAAAAGKAPIR
ncbi:GNAT family N-acetyltransferase [Kitasatospora phosalacinea]|uniref:GNAT family N-acetyltransferase n=1 Tax=Kitasatospora phosalacinea TaxID=2065 RepID=A0ABW6GS94_9ACTN